MRLDAEGECMHEKSPEEEEWDDLNSCQTRSLSYP